MSNEQPQRPERVEYPGVTVHLPPEQIRPMHEAVERIARNERRALAERALIGALSASVVLVIAWIMGSNAGVLCAGTLVVSKIGTWVVLSLGRPASVKPWGAER
jgi:hypothetical protein